MKRKSIIYKLIIVLIISSVLMGVSLYIISGIQLREIIDHSQKEVYEERLETIMSAISSKYKALIETGISEAYEADFQMSLLISLGQTYYGKNDSAIYPFIINLDGGIVMHPQYYRGDTSLVNRAYIKKMVSVKNGNFEYIYEAGQRKWCIIKYFEPWGWIVGYAIPLDLKYSDANKFLFNFIILILVVSFVTIVTVSIIFKRVLFPITALTNASKSLSYGEWEYDLNVSSDDELGLLANTFVEMRDSIKKNIEELSKTKSYLNNVINSMPSILIGIDEEGNVINMNIEAQKYTSVDLDDAIGKPITEIFPDFSEFISEMKETIRSRMPVEKNKIQHRVNDEIHIANITTFPLVTNGIKGAVIRIDDVTEKTRLEEMMVQTEKMMSVGGLAAGMAHEINNPLAAIIQGIQNTFRRISPDIEKNQESAIKAGVDLDSLNNYIKDREIDKFLNGIKDAGIRAAGIVQNMLNFSRQSEAILKEENINVLIDQTIELASHDYNLKKKYDFKKIEIVKSYESEILSVQCVRSEIEQVILNLLKNGAEIMNEKSLNPPTPFGKGAISDDTPLAKGEMSRSDRGDYVPTFYIRTYKKNSSVFIEVEDNGPGIREEILKRVFEPFFTTKPVGKGTGLGLSVSYFIITQNHKGNMWVESEVGQGAKFVIELPI